MTAKNKNRILLSTFVIGNLPHIFFGNETRLNLSLFIERSTRIDWFAIHYVNAINFLILAYCVYRNEGIDKRFSLFVLIVTFIDFLHLLLFAMQGFGMAKIGLSALLYFIIKNKKNNG